ncbi:hypothetical protein AB0F07_22035 [Streptomyces fructofermentans]|uniref:hypothetical protein n=1 Tax=Streptomyces fructofermentans TaxID=152141 RepID=UPI0033F20C68
MGKLSDVLARHLWLQVVLSWVAATAVILLIYPGRSVAGVLARIAVTSVGAVWIAVRVRSREKRAAGGSAADLVSLDRQLRTGEVPAEPKRREAMRTLVDRRLHRTRHRGVALVLLAVLLTAVVVLTALTAGLRQTLGLSLFTVVFGTWAVVGGNRQQRRLLQMRERLGAGPGPDVTHSRPGQQPQPR